MACVWQVALPASKSMPAELGIPECAQLDSAVRRQVPWKAYVHERSHHRHSRRVHPSSVPLHRDGGQVEGKENVTGKDSF